MTAKLSTAPTVLLMGSGSLNLTVAASLMLYEVYRQRLPPTR